MGRATREGNCSPARIPPSGDVSGGARTFKILAFRARECQHAVQARAGVSLFRLGGRSVEGEASESGFAGLGEGQAGRLRSGDRGRAELPSPWVSPREGRGDEGWRLLAPSSMFVSSRSAPLRAYHPHPSPLPSRERGRGGESPLSPSPFPLGEGRRAGHLPLSWPFPPLGRGYLAGLATRVLSTPGSPALAGDEFALQGSDSGTCFEDADVDRPPTLGMQPLL